MNDTIFLLVKLEIKHPFPNVHEAIAELQQKAVCRISNTVNVKVKTAKALDYNLKKQIMKHDFEQRRERRIENARNRAQKNKQEAERLFERAGDMASAIPMGQPILVGHHSEGRDRRYRARIQETGFKAVATQKKAEYYSEKAESIENNKAIFSDDPKALEKLKSELKVLKDVQEFMKAANKCLKKQDKAGFLKLLYGSEQLWEQLNVPDRLHGKGFPSYKLTNNGANIRRLEKRVEQLGKLAKRIPTDKTVNGMRILENKEANRLQLFFPGKPADEVRKKLKSCGFRWSPSEGAWQRHISNGALYDAENIAAMLADH